MAKPIRLSPKHGVNPCISVCFLCGSDKGEIAPLGKLPNDAEAPARAILDYEPCDNCKEKMKLGVALIGVTQTPNNPGQPSITHEDPSLYPTGSMVVMKPDAIRRMIPDTAMAEGIIKHGVSFVDEIIIRNIIDEHPNTKSSDTT